MPTTEERIAVRGEFIVTEDGEKVVKATHGNGVVSTPDGSFYNRRQYQVIVNSNDGGEDE